MSAPKRIGADAFRPGRPSSYVAIPVGSRRGTRFTAEAPLGERPPAEEEGAREAPGRCGHPVDVETLTWSSPPPERTRTTRVRRGRHLVTLNADGSPQVSRVSVRLDDDEIGPGHLPFNQKLRNVERDLAWSSRSRAASCNRLV